MTRFYDIIYKTPREDLPSSVIVDLESYPWSKDIPIGFGNLNSKAYLAIKAVTGCEPISCKLDLNYKKDVA